MPIQYNEFPKHPVPHVPPPQAAEHVSTPMVYVYEQQRWEYKVVARKPKASMSEADLNTLGKNGWELTGVVAACDEVQYYFKRVRR